MLDQFRSRLARLLDPKSAVHCSAHLTQHYKIEALDKDGNVKWTEEFDNLVTTEGLNKYLDATLKTGLAAPAWYVGIVKAKTTGFAAGDTLASHGGWTECVLNTDYTGNRITWTPGTVGSGSVDNSASKASFPILGTLTIYGAFLASVATGTAGVLLGGGDFGSSRSVLAGDTLQVTVTCSLVTG